MTVQEQDKLREQYIYEKSLFEQYGSHSIITFDEWLEIKRINYDKRRTN